MGFANDLPNVNAIGERNECDDGEVVNNRVAPAKVKKVPCGLLVLLGLMVATSKIGLHSQALGAIWSASQLAK
jgi:hypothetical protein